MLSRTQLECLLTPRLSAQTARKAIPPYLGDCISLQNADAILDAAAEWDSPHECVLLEEISYALDEANGLAWHHNVFVTRRRGKTNYDLELEHSP
jgi:hypothetical protein